MHIEYYPKTPQTFVKNGVNKLTYISPTVIPKKKILAPKHLPVPIAPVSTLVKSLIVNLSLLFIYQYVYINTYIRPCVRLTDIYCMCLYKHIYSDI